jgi:hypothetical protein
VELQRQLLTSHHRMQKALRAVVTAEQFERLRRRLENAAAPAAKPEAKPEMKPIGP